MDLRHLLTTREDHLVEVFIVFVGMLFLFAARYLQLYRRNTGNFLFNSDIQRDQSSATRLELEASTPKHKLVLSGLEELSRIITERHSNSMIGEFEVTSGARFQSQQSAGRGGSYLNLYVFFPDREMWQLAAMVVRSTLSGVKHWERLISRAGVQTNEKLKKDVARLESLSGTGPDIWSYWDFFYFSTIVQTTVGFGDILPNSTPVRMLVSFQIVMGYALLIVVVNVVINS